MPQRLIIVPNSFATKMPALLKTLRVHALLVIAESAEKGSDGKVIDFHNGRNKCKKQ